MQSLWLSYIQTKEVRKLFLFVFLPVKEESIEELVSLCYISKDVMLCLSKKICSPEFSATE